jgi:hypothetical protein
LAEHRDHLPPETIGAFAEGRLEGEPRASAVAHLAACEECREVLAGTLEALGEVGAREGETAAYLHSKAAPPIPAGTTLDGLDRLGSVHELRAPLRRRNWAPAVAVAAAVVVASLLVWRPGLDVSPPSRTAWLAAQPSAKALLPHLWGGVVTRGGEADHELRRSSAEVGALLVDLDVALAAADPRAAAELAYRVAGVLEAAGLLDTEVATIREAAGGLGGEARLRALRRALPAAEPAIRERLSPHWLDVGSFVEQARLSALAGRDPFANRRARRYAQSLMHDTTESLTAEQRTALRQFMEAAPAGRGAAGETALRALTR